MRHRLLSRARPHPPHRARARARPSPLGPAIEGTPRTESPLQNTTRRFPVEPITVGRTRLEVGEAGVGVALGRRPGYPGRYTDPDTFDPELDAWRPSFDHRAHLCVGARPTRMETRVAIGAVPDRLPGSPLSVPETEPRRWSGMITHGLFSPSITFDRDTAHQDVPT